MCEECLTTWFEFTCTDEGFRVGGFWVGSYIGGCGCLVAYLVAEFCAAFARRK